MPAGNNARTPVLSLSIDPDGRITICKACAREYYPNATATEIKTPAGLIEHPGDTCDCCLKPVH